MLSRPAGDCPRRPHPLTQFGALLSARRPAVEYSPFYGIEKGAVLQEARVFNEPHVDPRKCQQVITKLLYLLTQGESFTKVGSLFAAIGSTILTNASCPMPLRHGVVMAALLIRLGTRHSGCSLASQLLVLSVFHIRPDTFEQEL